MIAKILGISLAPTGAGLIIYGLAQLHPPLAFIAGGAMCIYVAWSLAE